MASHFKNFCKNSKKLQDYVKVKINLRINLESLNNINDLSNFLNTFKV